MNHALRGHTMKHYLASAVLLLSVSGAAAEPVTIDNFVRAETDTAIRNGVNLAGLGSSITSVYRPLLMTSLLSA